MDQRLRSDLRSHLNRCMEKSDSLVQLIKEQIIRISKTRSFRSTRIEYLLWPYRRLISSRAAILESAFVGCTDHSNSVGVADHSFRLENVCVGGGGGGWFRGVGGERKGREEKGGSSVLGLQAMR